MRIFNKQENQTEINDKILKHYFAAWTNFNFEDNSDLDGTNTWLPLFLKGFIHSDTYFEKNSVRIQGWFKPVEGDTILPKCVVEGINKNGLFIQDLTLNKTFMTDNVIYWKDSKKVLISVDDMDINYLRNTIKMIITSKTQTGANFDITKHLQSNLRPNSGAMNCE